MKWTRNSKFNFANTREDRTFFLVLDFQENEVLVLLWTRVGQVDTQLKRRMRYLPNISR